MKRFPALLLLALLGACGDSSSGPEPVRDLDITLGAVQVSDQTIVVGTTVKLSATVSDGSGQPLSGRRVSWRSTLPEVASVDSTGLVTGVSAGSALVIATAEAAADTTRITVTAPVAGAPVCATGETGLNLAVGEVRTFTAAQAATVCLSGGGAGAEFTYIPFNASANAQNLALEIVGGGVVAAQGPPNPARIPTRDALVPGSAGASENWRFHQRLRAEESQLLARGFPASAVQRSLTRAAVPAVGDRLRLSGDPDASCTQPDLRTATVEAVSRRAIIAADSAARNASDEPFTRADYEYFANLFDSLIWPTVTEAMGTPTDLDANERVILFFTTAVNALTDPGSGSYTGGFFHPRDLSPNTGAQSCAASNFGEVLYLLVPDSALVRQNLNPFRRAAALDRSPGVIGHELQHVINASSRRTRGVSGEEVWLNEGLSHIAEELLFYRAGNVDSEQNIDLTRIRGSQQLVQAYNFYQASNFGRLLNYLEEPEDQSLIGVQNDDDLPTRGASWAFLRYAADQETDGEAAKREIWYKLVNSTTRGVTNVEQVFGTDALGLMQDWTTSVYTDDAGLPVPARYQQPSWNFRAFFQQSNIGRYPLATIQLTDGLPGVRVTRLQGGGAAFLRFGIAANGRAAVRITSGGAAAPERLRVSIVRTK